MVISFSNLVDNLAEWIYEIRCKYVHDKKKNEKQVELNVKNVSLALNTQTLKRI